jgi:PmbA protein
VYLGQRRGNASTSDFSRAALEQTVQAAYDIARFTAEDPAAGLPDAEDLASPRQAAIDLDLFHPWAIDAAKVPASWRCAARPRPSPPTAASPIPKARACRRSSRTSGPATRAGFRGGYASSRHYGLSVSPIAGRGNGMQRDYWYTSMRDPADLAAPEAVGRYAAERALSRLKSRKIAHLRSAGAVRVHAGVGPAGQPGAGDVRAVRCTARPPSWKAAWASPCWRPTWTWTRTRSSPRARAVRLRRRGRAHQRAARGRGRRGAGLLSVQLFGAQAGPADHRPCWRGAEPGAEEPSHPAGDDLEAMLRKLGRGLFVTELMGQGVNGVTGDYSRGAAGFWVEGGRIAHPVHEVTIAGNLRDMLRDIVAVGADVYTSGSRTTGSILVQRMKVAGA